MRSGIPSLFLLDNIEIKDSFDQAADFVCEERAVSAPAMPLDNFAASSPIKTRGRTAHAPPADLEQTVSVPDALHPGTHDIQTSFNDSLDVSIEHDCEGCDGEWRGLEGCPLHGPLQIVLDTEVPLGEPDRALRTLPPQLAVLRSKIPGAGLGVCSAEDVPAMVRFGPYEGEVTARDRQSGYAWNILVPDGPDHFLDGEDVTKSNWMRYVNCARNIAEQNLHAYQHAGRVYYRTVRPVPAHTELLVWYGDSYAQDLGIDSARRHPPGWILGADSHCDGSADATFRTGGFHEGSGDASPGTDGHCGRVAEANPGSDGEISRPLKRRRSPCVSLPPSPPGLALKQAKSTSSQLLCSAKAAALPKQLRSGRVSVPTQRLQVGHNKTPRCGTCSAAFRSAEALRAHERRHPTLCRVSGPHLEDGAAFQRHLRVHPDAAEFKCEDCGTPFNSQERLRNHRCRHPRLKQHHGSLSETFDAQKEHELSQDGALGGDASRPTGTPCSTPCGAQLEHGDAPQRHRGEQPGVAESKCNDGVDADESLSEGADLGEDHRASECGEGPADEPTDEDDDQEPHRCLRCTAHFVHIEDLRTHLSSHRRVLAEKKQKRDRRKGKKDKKNKRKKEEDGKERKRTEDREEWWKRMEDEIESAEKKMEREEKDRERKAKGHWRPVACNRCDESTVTFATREAFLKHILQAHYWFTEEIRKKERKRRDEEKNKKDREKNRKEIKILKEKATKKGRERKKKKVKKKKKGERGCWRPVACNRCGEDTETFATRKAFLKHILQAHTGQ